MNNIWGNYPTAMEPFNANDGHGEHEQCRPDTLLQGLLILALGPTWAGRGEVSRWSGQDYAGATAACHGGW